MGWPLQKPNSYVFVTSTLFNFLILCWLVPSRRYVPYSEPRGLMSVSPFILWLGVCLVNATSSWQKHPCLTIVSCYPLFPVKTYSKFDSRPGDGRNQR